MQYKLFESITCLRAEGVEFYSSVEILDSICREAMKGCNLCETALKGCDFRMDELDAVMHSVDKWFEDDDPRLKLNPATRAAEAREIALCAIEAQGEEP